MSNSGCLSADDNDEIKDSIQNVLTNICTQCPQIKAMMIVPTKPTSQPALAKAKGIARMPEPNDAFTRLASDLISLKSR